MKNIGGEIGHLFNEFFTDNLRVAIAFNTSVEVGSKIDNSFQFWFKRNITRRINNSMIRNLKNGKS